MKMILELEMSDLTLNKEKSAYNHLWWDIRANNYGVTHMIEIYDDVSNYPDYEVYKGKEMVTFGVGDAIDDECQGRGGVFVQIDLYNGDIILRRQSGEM